MGDPANMTPDELTAMWRTRALFYWRQAYRMAKRAGWHPFGTHLEPGVELEFDGLDEDGLPLWERLKGK